MVTPNQAADNVRPASNPLQEAALAAAARGFRVFPCHDVAGGACSCGTRGCKRPGKHPRILAWQKKATTDEAQIRAWRTTWPNANIGVATGPESGIFALDVDGPEGEATLRALVQLHGPLPLTLTHFTGGGGTHYVFRYPPDRTIGNSAGKLGRGLDVRGKGGYVLWPPSRTNKGRYKGPATPTLLPIVPAPDWLLDLIAPPSAAGPPPSSSATRPTTRPSGNGRRGRRPSAEERARLYLADADPAVQGQGGSAHTLYVARVVVWGFDLGAEVGLGLMLEAWNETCLPRWSEADLRHKCEEADKPPFDKPRGWMLAVERPRAGERHKRNTALNSGDTVRVSANERERSQTSTPPSAPVEEAPNSGAAGPTGPAGGPQAGPPDTERDSGRVSPGQGTQADAREGGASKRGGRKAAPESAGLPEAPRAAGGPQNGSPPDGPQLYSVGALRERKPEWLWAGRVQLGAINILEGRKGEGKTTMTAALAAAVTGGPPLPGQRTCPQGNVLYLTREACYASAIRPRLRVAQAGMDRVLFFGQPGRKDRPYPLSLPAQLPLLEETIRQNNVRLLVLDPWTSFTAPGINLNDERQARCLLEELADVLAATGAAGLLIRHPRKSSVGPAIDQGMGSAGISATARVVMSVYADPDVKGGRVLAVVASNEAKHAPSLRFGLVDEGGAVRVAWQGESDLDADQLADGRDDVTERDRRERAKAFLRSELATGKQRTTVLQQRALEAGLAWRTVERAKVDLGVDKGKTYEDGRPVWWFVPPPDGWQD